MKKKQKTLLKSVVSFVLSAAVMFGTMPVSELHAEPTGQDGQSAESAFEIGDEDNNTAWTLIQAALAQDGTKRADGEDEEHPTYFRLTADCVAASGKEPISVPKDRYIVLDLAGHSLNKDHKGGRVLEIRGNLEICDSLDGGGIISGNAPSSEGGAGVYISKTGAFTMNGGRITGCVTSTGYTGSSGGRGGGVLVDGGTFTLNGGRISENEQTTVHNGWCGGGGVYVDDNGTFTMNGGEISNNSSVFTGGGIYVKKGIFLMTGGTVSDNTVEYTENGYPYGAGIMIGQRSGDSSDRGYFYMSGGSITGNQFLTKAGKGAGVCVGIGEFHMTGGSITDNAKNGLTGISYGGGVFVCVNSNNVCTIGGKIEIHDNGKDNIYLEDAGSNRLSITHKLENRIPIMIATTDGYFSSDYKVAKGGGSPAYTITHEDMSKLSSCRDAYLLGLDDDACVHLTELTHTVTFDQNGGVGNMEAQKVPKNLRVMLTENTFTRENFRFMGWNTKADGSGISYTDKGIMKTDSDITLYAQWSDDPFVTFIHNGGKDESSTQIIRKETDTALSANTFTREHYRFKEWTTNIDGSGTKYADGATVNLTDNLILYAQWERSECIVTYQANDGSDQNTTGVHSLGQTSQLDACSFSRAHYVFNGWNTKADGSGEAYSDEQSVTLTEDLILFAQWKQTECVIEFDKNQGEGSMADQIMEINKEAALNKNIFTREGYRFSHWSVYRGDTLIGQYSDGQVIKPQEDLRLVANWKKERTLSFDANGGEGYMAPLVFFDDEAFEIPKNAFTREGYIFTGWNSLARGIGKSYTDQATVVLSSMGDVCFYAQWKKLYKVTFDANGGTGSMQPQIFVSGVSKTLSENTITREGYVFDGWNTKADGSGIAYRDGAWIQLSEDVTMYAMWKKLVRVNFDANGGTGSMQPLILVSGVSKTLSENTIKKEGYVFDGWNTKADGSGIAYWDGVRIQLSEDVTLYAMWKKLVTIKLEANDGTGRMLSRSTKSGNEILLGYDLSFDRNGYLFKDWNTNADGSGVSYSGYERINLSEDLTLYAQWAKSVTLTLDKNIGDGDQQTGQIIQGVRVPIYAQFEQFKSPGYGIMSWNTKADGSGVSYDRNGKIIAESDMTLYAQWVKTPSISLYPEEGSDRKITLPDGLYIPGEWCDGSQWLAANSVGDFKLTGWNTKPDGSGTEYEPDAIFVSDRDMDLYAQYEKDPVVVEYYYTGEIAKSEFDSEIGSKTRVIYAKGEKVRLPIPDDLRMNFDEGKAFLSWNTEPDGGGTSYAAGTEISIMQNMELYARLTEDVVTVRYLPNGSREKSYQQSCPRGKNSRLLKCRFVDGPDSSNGSENADTAQVCVGWNTKADGTGTAYGLGDEAAFTENTDLYAQWEAVQGALTMESRTYGEIPAKPVFSSNISFSDIWGAGAKLTFRYKRFGANDNTSVPFVPVNAGTYTAMAVYNYRVVATADFSVFPKTVSVNGITAPTPKTELTGNGKTQILIDAGSAEGCTMLYAVTRKGEPEPALELFTPELPGRKDVGDYTVWYKAALGQEYFNEVSKTYQIEVSIKKSSDAPESHETEKEEKEVKEEKETRPVEGDDKGIQPEGETEPAKVGDVITDSKTKAIVMITSVKPENPTAEYIGFADEKAKSAEVPAEVLFDGTVYKVISVRANAFKSGRLKTVTLGRNVSKLKAKAFKGSKVKTIIIKTVKLTSKSVKNSLKGSKAGKITIKVKVGSKKQNKKYVKKYKKCFTVKNAGKKAIVK
ncbi:MAG: InlB B-repeat-containing protein [Lachnospiraceae bacterium]|nr:InlB B-repeat-containing protein [Lachnospiraceae bacterium]